MMHRSLTERSKDFSFLNDSEDSDNKFYKKKKVEASELKTSRSSPWILMDSPL